ncbi:uncharacterized protein [Dendropsophus ebraccatus]
MDRNKWHARRKKKTKKTSCSFVEAILDDVACYSQMGSNVSCLIGLLEDHPCLWNTNDPKYNDRRHKANAWKTIILTLYLECDTLPNQTKKQIGKGVKTCWRSVRDQFRKYENNAGKSGSSPTRKKPAYYDQLQFLKTGQQLRDTEGNISAGSSGSSDEAGMSQEATAGPSHSSKPRRDQPPVASGGGARRGRLSSKSAPRSIVATAIETEALSMIKRVDREDHWDQLSYSIAERIRQLPEERQWVSIPAVFELLDFFAKPHPIPDNVDIFLALKKLTEMFQKRNISDHLSGNLALPRQRLELSNPRMSTEHITHSVNVNDESQMGASISTQYTFLELLSSTSTESPDFTPTTYSSQFRQFSDPPNVRP